MNSADIKQYKARRNLIYLCNGIYICFIYVAALVYFFIQAMLAKNSSAAGVIVTLFLSMLAWMVPVLIWFNRHGYDKDPVPPYSIETNCYTIEKIFDNIQKEICLLTICNDTLCNVEMGKRRIHWIVHLAGEYNIKSVKKAMTEASATAFEKKVFPCKMSMTEYNKTIRCNIIIVNSMNEEAISASEKNAVNGMNSGESTLNVILDLASGNLIIPALWGGTIANCRTYGIVINRLISIFT